MTLLGSRGAPRLAAADVPPTDRPTTRRGPHQVWRLLAAGAGLVGLTTVMVLVGDQLHLDLALMFYLLAVVIISITVGRLAGLAAALISYLLALFWFAQPRGEFRLSSRHHFLELTIFMVIAAMVGVVAHAAARRRWQLAEEVANSRQLAELDRVRTGLLSAVSHDLRTPLAGIKANAAALRYAGDSWTPDLRVELLTSIEESADRLADMVSSILDLSRIRSGALEAHLAPVALHDIVARALAIVDSRSTTVEVAEDLPLVWADPALLERVVANLVANAQTHAPDAPPAVVRADPVETGVRLAVVDHGPGIAEDRWPEVFQPFQRLTDTGGSIGLGLAIAQGCCEAIGTTLTPEHTPGGGLTMSVVLAVAR